MGPPNRDQKFHRSRHFQPGSTSVMQARFSVLMFQKCLVKRGHIKRCATGAVAAGKTFWNLAVERVRNRNSTSSFMSRVPKRSSNNPFLLSLHGGLRKLDRPSPTRCSQALWLWRFRSCGTRLGPERRAHNECLGFRFNATAPDLRIAGFACCTGGTSAVLLIKPALGCLLDRLQLAPGSDDESLVWFFAAHETIGIPAFSDRAPEHRDGHFRGSQTAALGATCAGSAISKKPSTNENSEAGDATKP
jgi:hypothetical protein